MNNELLTLIVVLFYLGCAMGTLQMGKIWLQSFLVLSYILTLSIVGCFFDFFGFSVNAGAITYAGIFLATDALTERYGKKVGFQTVRITFTMTLIFVAITQLTLLLEPSAFAQEGVSAMQQVFGSSLRIMSVGFVVYLFIQHLDVWLYHKIHERTGSKFLWLRNNASTLTSQLIDSILFFGLAFYGTMPNDQLIEIIITAYLFKAGIALLDTPFMYVAKHITPWDERR